MSRSYRKFLSWPSSEYEPVQWPGIRIKERRCIYDEFHCAEYGEALFPTYHRTREGSWSGSSRIYQSKKEIRDGYFKEIRDILNGFQDLSYWRNEDYQGIFIEDFYRIKNDECPEGNLAVPARRRVPDGLNSRFEWLNTREAKEAVKKWEGDPLDVLYYLVREGIIERAVCCECKMRLRK